MAGRGNTANLCPFRRGEARARDAGRAGGLRSAVVRAESRALAEWAKQLCDTTASRRGGMTNGEAVVRKLYQSAMRGSIRAARLLADLTGEMPGGARRIVLDKGGGAALRRLIIDPPADRGEPDRIAGGAV